MTTYVCEVAGELVEVTKTGRIANPINQPTRSPLHGSLLGSFQSGFLVEVAPVHGCSEVSKSWVPSDELFEVEDEE